MATEGPIKPIGNLSVWLVDDTTVYWQGPAKLAEDDIRTELIGFRDASEPPPDAPTVDLVNRMLAVATPYEKSRAPKPPHTVPPVIIEGPPGPPGERGSLWLSGTGVPLIAGNELIDDKYLNTTTGDVYTWTGAEWLLTGNIKGEHGGRGEKGEVGPTGPQGPPGAAAVAATPADNNPNR